MRLLALLVAVFVAAFGLTGLVSPDWLLSVGRTFLTPGGLYIAAAVRIAMGVILFMAAGGSRAPRVLKVFGVVAILAGLTTPLVGVENARAMVAWEAARPMVIRAGAALAVALGAFIAVAVASPKREATHA